MVWTDDPLEGIHYIKPIHIQELRNAVVELYNEAGLQPPQWTDPDLQGKHVRLIHIQEIRQALDNLEPIYGGGCSEHYTNVNQAYDSNVLADETSADHSNYNSQVLNTHNQDDLASNEANVRSTHNISFCNNDETGEYQEHNSLHFDVAYKALYSDYVVTEQHPFYESVRSTLYYGFRTDTNNKVTTSCSSHNGLDKESLEYVHCNVVQSADERSVYNNHYGDADTNYKAYHKYTVFQSE